MKLIDKPGRLSKKPTLAVPALLESA